MDSASMGPDEPAGVAQLAEHPPCKRTVSGSNPLTGSIFRTLFDRSYPLRARSGRFLGFLGLGQLGPCRFAHRVGQGALPLVGRQPPAPEPRPAARKFVLDSAALSALVRPDN